MQASSTTTGAAGAPAGGDHESTAPAAPDGTPQDSRTRPKRLPPDSIPDLMPGVDPQQTPGIDHPPAEWD